VAARDRPEHVRERQQHEAECEGGGHDARRHAATVETETEHEGGHATGEEDEQRRPQELSYQFSRHVPPFRSTPRWGTFVAFRAQGTSAARANLGLRW
jgi:hypothetical protein